jgi:hypothetical protein
LPRFFRAFACFGRELAVMSNTDSFSPNEAASPIGFAPPRHRPLGQERGVAALASLIASIVLVAATLIVAAAVSSGPPRPDRGEATASWDVAAQRG